MAIHLSNLARSSESSLVLCPSSQDRHRSPELLALDIFQQSLAIHLKSVYEFRCLRAQGFR